MKKTILLSGIFAVSAAFATDVTSGNAIGALDKAIQSDGAKQILIAVPFLGYDGAESAISVKDIVKTSSLSEGSKIFVPNGTTGGYDTLKLGEDGTWVPDKKVTIDSKGTITDGESLGSQDVTIKRGDSFWLEPKFPDQGASGTVFLLGQGETTAGTSTAAAGWNLIGNASVETVDLKNLAGEDGDQIVVQNGAALHYYTYKDAWCHTMRGKITPVEALRISPGQGLWYKPKTAKTIDWSTGTVKNN